MTKLTLGNIIPFNIAKTRVLDNRRAALDKSKKVIYENIRILREYYGEPQARAYMKSTEHILKKRK